jgi:hypothetical protein
MSGKKAFKRKRIWYKNEFTKGKLLHFGKKTYVSILKVSDPMWPKRTKNGATAPYNTTFGLENLLIN